MDASHEAAPSTVPDPVRQGARRAPEAPALIAPDGSALSYGALDAAADRTAARLEVAGIGAGDGVACLMPRGPAYVTLLLGLWRRRAVAAPLPARTPAAGRPRLLEAIVARVFVAGEDIAQAPAPVRTLRVADLIGGDGASYEASPPGTALPEASWPSECPLTLVFTSGTMGAPKAALHTAGNHFFSAEGSRQNLPLVPGDRWLLSLPLYHVGGLAVVLRCLWAGAAVAFPQRDERPVDAMRRTGATHVSLVSAQLRRLLDAVHERRRPLAVLKAVLLGGGPVPPALLEDAYRAGLPVAMSYGLTEMASQVTTTAPGDPLGALLRTAGRPLPHRCVRIRTEDSGKEGEIMVAGRTRFAGYIEDGRLREPFEEAFGEGGWFATGDLGRLDAVGRLRVTGRRDRRFVSGGENVQPEEIEAALRRLPEVADAAVVSVPHETFGRRPVAFIQGQRRGAFQPGERSAALREALRDVLPEYKVPDAFHPWPDEADGDMKPDHTLLQQQARRLDDEEKRRA